MEQNDWIYGFTRWILENSKEHINEKVRKLKANYSNLTNEELVDKIILGDAIFASGVGFSMKMIKIIPGVEELVLAGTILPEIVALTFKQIYCIIFIAEIYGVDLDNPDIMLQILLILGIASGMESIKKAIRGTDSQNAGIIIETLGGLSNLSKNICEGLILKFSKTGLLKKLPLIAAPISAGLNYLNLSATGKAAKYYFNNEYYDDGELNDMEIMKYKQAKAIVALMIYMAKADKVYKKVENDIIEIVRQNINIPEKFQEEFDKAIHGPLDWGEIRDILKLKESKIALLIQLFVLMYLDDEQHPEEVKVLEEIALNLNIPQEDVKSVEKKILALHWYNKGLTSGRLGNYEEAVKFYDKTLEIAPKDTDTLNNKGNMLYKLENYEEAIKFFDKTLEIDSEYKSAWNNKGLILYNQAKYDESIRCFNKALKIDPKYKSAWNNKRLALQSKQD